MILVIMSVGRFLCIERILGTGDVFYEKSGVSRHYKNSIKSEIWLVLHG